jgi:hypothetical protein
VDRGVESDTRHAVPIMAPGTERPTRVGHSGDRNDSLVTSSRAEQGPRRAGSVAVGAVDVDLGGLHRGPHRHALDEAELTNRLGGDLGGDSHWPAEQATQIDVYGADGD